MEKPSLLELYEQILKVARLQPDEVGCISAVYGDKKSPVILDGKRLVMPTQEQLRSGDWSTRVVFHPLSENIMKEPSQVLDNFRTSINHRLNHTLPSLMMELLIIATSVGEHHKLSPDQSEFLSYVKSADEKTVEAFKRIILNTKDEAARSFAHIYIKRSGMLHGKKHARVGVMTFALYEALTESKEDVFGVKLRKMDREALINLYEYIFPSIKEKDAYNQASDSTIAPNLDVLMKTVIGLGSCINDTVELFRNVLEEPDEYVFEASWVPVFENLSVMESEIRKVPMQSGNDQPAPTQAPVPAPAPQPAAPQAAQPAPPVAPATYPGYPPATPGYGFPPQQQFGYQPQFQQPVYGAPPQQYNQAPLPGQNPNVVRTGRGVDFNSLLATDPTIAMAPSMAYGNNQQFQQPGMGMGMGFGMPPARAVFRGN